MQEKSFVLVPCRALSRGDRLYGSFDGKGALYTKSPKPVRFGALLTGDRIQGSFDGNRALYPRALT